VYTYTHAAFVHGEESEGDHEVGDLQDLLRAAWALMTEEQRIEFLFTDEAKAVLTAPPAPSKIDAALHQGGNYESRSPDPRPDQVHA
jgi:hypothetical protein